MARKVNFKKLKDEEDNGTKFVRTTRMKLAITGDYNEGSGERVEFFKKRKGIEIKWSGRGAK